jgi:UDP-N-acetylmuramate: L-alanyl-gamma-D-glutamyl-meso-diaminopimelate ligase
LRASQSAGEPYVGLLLSLKSSSVFGAYNARNVLLTSAIHDHVNIFPTHADFPSPFRKLLISLPTYGVLVVNSSEPYARALGQESGRDIVYYATDDPEHWHVENIERLLQVTNFDLFRAREKVVRLSTKLIGHHNVENIVGASAMLLEKKLITVDELNIGVNSFMGVKRRMEFLSPLSTIAVYEGFGSSYDKARSAIAAIKLHFRNRRLIVVFEPHTFTWRN